jgi:hypothetical protein
LSMTSTMIRATVLPFVGPAWQRSVRDAMPSALAGRGVGQGFAQATPFCHDGG